MKMVDNSAILLRSNIRMRTFMKSNPIENMIKQSIFCKKEHQFQLKNKPIIYLQNMAKTNGFTKQ
jgi:hypothetical protein